MDGRLSVVCILLATFAMGARVTTRPAAAQDAGKASEAAGALTIEQARQVLAARSRPGGWWVTSNAAYAEGTEETASYAMQFQPVPGGLASTGCLWGETDAEVFGPYWYFYAAWDPVEEAILVYQSSPGGAAAIGHQTSERETVQTIQLPGQPAFRIRHTSEFPDPDTLVDQSFNEVDGAWQERRQYTWVWTPAEGRESPC
jgi:hypothetical protein